MYQIMITISNPQTGASKQVARKFDPDPAVFTQAKWNSAFPGVKSKVDELLAESVSAELATW